MAAAVVDVVVAAVLSSLRAYVCLRYGWNFAELALEHKCNYRQGLVQASTQGKSKHRNRHRGARVKLKDKARSGTGWKTSTAIA